MSLSTRLEDAIRILSPAWANKRAAYRELSNERLSAWRDSRRTRLDSGRGRTGLADTLLEFGNERREVMQRAREAERTNVIAEALLSRSNENVVGDGLTLRCLSGSPKWNQRVEEEFKEWADNEADVRGLSTLDQLDALKFRSLQRDGDVGTIHLSDEKLQLFESDQLASPARPLARNMVDGVELDRRGRPISYWVVSDPDPRNNAVRQQVTTSIPAEWVSFMARRQRIGQTRGLSTFAGSLWLLDQIDGNISAVTSAARMAACLGLIINRERPRRGPDSGPTQVGADGKVRKKLTLEPGAFMELGKDDKVTTLTPSQPTTNFADFMAALARFAGLGFGLPIELFLMDFTKSNYSQARGALLQAHKVTKRNQQIVKRDKSFTFKWWLINRMQSGRIQYRAKALRHAWTPPARELLDSEKELKSAMGLVDAGLCTLAEVAAGMGRDWFEILETREKEIAEYEKRGITRSKSLLTRDGAGIEIVDEEDEPEEDEPEEDGDEPGDDDDS